jgi:elongation factor Ts
LVALSAAAPAGAEEVSRNVAMQGCCYPIALNEEGVDAAVIEKEIEIAKDLLRQEGKPIARSWLVSLKTL